MYAAKLIVNLTYATPKHGISLDSTLCLRTLLIFYQDFTVTSPFATKEIDGFITFFLAVILK